MIGVAERRVFLAVIALAAIGYFDYTYRLPRLRLVLTAAVLFVLLPLWLVAIRRRPADAMEWSVLVGDNPEELEEVFNVCDSDVDGYVAPAAVQRQLRRELVVDGGIGFTDLPYLGGSHGSRRS